MKVTSLGIILTLKNIGTWIAVNYAIIPSTRTDFVNFCWSIFIYALINIPTDLYLLEEIKNEIFNENNVL